VAIDRTLDPGRRPIGLALLAALLFGVTTPAAKALLSETDPWLLAGLLYLGSGIGLGMARLVMRAVGRASREAPLRRADVPWLAGAIACGGGIGPGLLMLGLAGGSASQASLLLNLEGVLTALLAWLIFHEHIDARIAIGMGLITLGAVVLAWRPGAGLALDRSALFVAAACLAWAVDNNLTRRISGGDAGLIATLKGLVAGGVNLLIAVVGGAPWPSPRAAIVSGVVGLFGYGLSVMLFVRALRELGAARTGAYFSTAPFLGTVLAIVALGEPVSGRLVVGGFLMGAGVWLHLSERHAHAHAHEALAHEHRHTHDAHHDHTHESGAPAGEPHSHWHVHPAQDHTHRHYPDLHHGHPH
jgi:drug/metabolite transporter (DMT)-like permease